MGVIFEKRGKEPSPTAKKNYRQMKQNPLRVLSFKWLLLFFIPILFLMGFLLGNILLFFIQKIIPNLMTLVKGDYHGTLNIRKALFDFQMKQYPQYYTIVGLLTGYLTFKIIFRLRNTFRPLEDDLTQGMMEWSTHKQLKKEYELVPVTPFTPDEDFFEGTPGLPISRLPRTRQEKQEGTFRYLVDTSIGNMMILASTRIGKSRYYIDAFIDTISRAKNIEKRWSFVMTATKGTEPRVWYDTLKRRGYAIRVYNTVNQFYSDPFPVLKTFFTYYRHYTDYKIKAATQTNEKERMKFLIQSEQQLTNAENALRRAAQAYFIETNEGKDGGFWVKACRNLFMSLALALAEQAIQENDFVKVNPYTIQNVANKMISEKLNKSNSKFLLQYTRDKDQLKKMIEKYEDCSFLDIYFRELPEIHPAKKYYSAIMASAPAQTTLGNVLTHFDGDLESFLQSANAKMTSYDDGFEIESIGFGDKPTAVFVIFSDSDELNNKLGMLIVDQIYQLLKNRADLIEDPNHAHCVRPVVTIYEEAGNLGVPIPRLEQKWTAGLSRWLYSCLVLQDIAQLTNMYSKSVENTIMGNLANLVYIRSGSKETNDYIADQLGKRAIYSKTRQRDPLSIKSTETESVDRIHLLSPAELRRLRDGESVVLRLNHGEDKRGHPIYQYPIFNTFENDTNMIKFDAYRQLKTVSWEEIPVNNQFLTLQIEDLIWDLHPIPVENRKENDYDNPSSQSDEDFNLFPQATLSFLQKNDQLQKILSPNDVTGDKEEQLAKRKLLLTYQHFFNQVEDKLIQDFLQDWQILWLQQQVEIEFADEIVSQNEFKQIIHGSHPRFLSLVTFFISNGSIPFIEKVFAQLTMWEVGN